MLPRIWSCTEPAWWLRPFAAPLSPLLISMLLAAGFAAGLLRRPLLCNFLLRLAATAAVALIGTLMTFGMVAIALVQTSNNPSPALRALPWVGALVGVAAATAAMRRAQLGSAGGIRRLLARKPAGHTDSARLFLSGGLGGSLLLFLTLATRHVIDDVSPLSVPYRLFEYLVPDQVMTLASDECLTARALEYGVLNPEIGRPTCQELVERGDSAAAGVAAKLNDLRANWPPAPHTVTENGTEWLLRFLRNHGGAAQAQSWDAVDWRKELKQANDAPQPFSLRNAHWAAP